MNATKRNKYEHIVPLLILFLILIANIPCHADTLPDPPSSQVPELGEPFSIDYPQIPAPAVPQDNSFRSTGEWTEWKQPSTTYKAIHARVICLKQFGSLTYNIQFRNFYTTKAKVNFTSSSAFGSASVKDVITFEKGGVSKQTSMNQSCGSPTSPDVFVLIDSVYIEQPYGDSPRTQK